MNLGRFRQIVQQSIKAQPGLEAAMSVVEYALGNTAFSRYSSASVASGQEAIYIHMQAHHAVCKPTTRYAGLPNMAGAIATPVYCQPAMNLSSACCA